MTILNMCGFELGEECSTGDIVSSSEGGVGDAGTGSGALSGGARAVIQTTTVRSGQYALKTFSTVTDAVGGFLVMSKIAADGTHTTINLATVYYRFYFRWVVKPTAGYHQIARIFSASTVLKAFLAFDASGVLSLYDSTTTLLGTGSTVLDANTWYYIGIKCGTGASAAFEVTLAKDGINPAIEVSATGNVGTGNHEHIRIGKTGGTSTEPWEYYIDDIQIRDDDYPGHSRIIRLDAIGQGAGGYFTTGTVAEVDDYANQAGNDGDTTYAVSSVANDEHDVTLSSPTEIREDSTINAVKGLAVCRDESQTVAWNIKFAGSLSTAKTTSDFNQTYGAKCVLETSVTYTNLSTLRLSVVRTQSQSRPLRCTAMAVMVDYTPQASLLPTYLNDMNPAILAL
jgi:hypothetical protein